MIFLNPTILLGLLAASIPVVLHFLNLRKIKKVEFSTLAFLKELQKSKIRKIKIKQLLLLLLRILIIIFVVLSFARPTLESTSIGGISSDAKTTAIIIIDNSFSMSMLDEKGSFINQAKERAKDLLSSFKNGDEVHLLLSSGDQYELFPASQIIDAISISYNAAPLSNSFVEASKLLDKSNNLNKEVYLFSDFQKSMLFEEDSTKSDFNFINTRFYLFYFDSKTKNNIAITDLKINNQIFEVNRTVNTEVDVTNFSDANVSKLISLNFNELRVAQKSVTVPNSSTRNIQFIGSLDKTGIVEVIATLEDDDIVYDNKYFDFVFVPKKTNVLLIGKNEKEFRFIKSALQSNLGTKIKLSFVNSKNLNGINLENYNAIIVAGSNGGEFSKTIEKYISNGGNAVLFPSDEYAQDEENKLLSILNIPIAKTILKSDNHQSINSFSKIDFTHPIFSEIFNEQNKEIESPNFYSYLKFAPQGNGRSIITQSDNSSFMSEYRLNKGRILFFNVAPNLEWSNFPLKNIFAPLINRSISYLASNYTKEGNLVAGDILSVNVSNRKSNQIKIIKPNGSEEFINLNEGHNNYLNYSNSNLIGIYKFYSNNILLDVKAVNFNDKESNLDSLSTEEVSLKLDNETNVIVKISSADDYKSKIKNMQYGSELWHLFLGIAFMLALLEMYIAKSEKKDLVEL